MITIVTSCYNQAKYLSKAIESVLSQTYKDFEYILIDDGSSDNTWKIVQGWAKKDKRIRPVGMSKQSNVGWVLNHSINIMKGDYWVWCPADDILKDNLLEQKLKVSKQLNHSSVIYSGWQHIDEKDKIIGKVIPLNRSPREFASCIYDTCPLGCTGIWIPKSVFDEVGLFPIHLACSEDYAWILKAVSNNVPFVCLPEVLYKKRLHPNRITNREKFKISNVVSQIRAEYRRE